jgi:hypothetical protein
MNPYRRIPLIHRSDRQKIAEVGVVGIVVDSRRIKGGHSFRRLVDRPGWAFHIGDTVRTGAL